MKDLSLEAKQKSLQSGWKGRAEESDVSAEERAPQEGGPPGRGPSAWEVDTAGEESPGATVCFEATE